MEQKINIAELLKDCPKGTKLYSPLCGECVFQYIHSELKKIIISTSDGTTLSFHNNGKYYQMDNSECLIFPSKDQQDWSKFQRPFKDGDILVSGLNACKNNPFIFKRINGFGNAECYCAIDCYGDLIFNSDNWAHIEGCRFATEEEKQKLFDAIKSNGYKWDPETKTLEKLVEPQFKVGNVIQDKDGYKVKITEVNVADECYGYESVIAKGIGSIAFSEQDKWELAPNKFDINTLIPFESRVLARDNNQQKWWPAIWGYYDFNSHGYPHKLIGGGATRYCIPYEGNEHLIGTTEDCAEFYKVW